jgi:hypothetical protein
MFFLNRRADAVKVPGNREFPGMFDAMIKPAGRCFRAMMGWWVNENPGG